MKIKCLHLNLNQLSSLTPLVVVIPWLTEFSKRKSNFVWYNKNGSVCTKYVSKLTV